MDDGNSFVRHGVYVEGVYEGLRVDGVALKEPGWGTTSSINIKVKLACEILAIETMLTFSQIPRGPLRQPHANFDTSIPRKRLEGSGSGQLLG